MLHRGKALLATPVLTTARAALKVVRAIRACLESKDTRLRQLRLLSCQYQTPVLQWILGALKVEKEGKVKREEMAAAARKARRRLKVSSTARPAAVAAGMGGRAVPADQVVLAEQGAMEGQ
jgi:hypothetical protein